MLRNLEIAQFYIKNTLKMHAKFGDLEISQFHIKNTFKMNAKFRNFQILH
jgi:hypothetical protein